MAQSINIKTKQFRGCGFMTISRYNNSGDIIYISDKESKIISAIETKNYTIIGTFIGHNGVIWNLDISKDDKILVSCSGDMSIIIWNTIDGSILKHFIEPGIPKIVSIQKNCISNFIVIYYESISKRFKSYIKIYDLDKINLNNIDLENFDLENEEDLLINKIEWNENSKITIVFWINESKFIIGTEDGTIFIKDINLETIEQYKVHNGIIKSIVFNKQKNCILTSSLDATCKLISIETWEVLKTIESLVPINYAIFNHNDRKIILAGGLEAVLVAKTTNSDLNIKFYRTSDLKLLNQMSSHFGPVRYLDKSPKDKSFISASQDGTVKIYLIQDEEPNIKIDNNINDENILIDKIHKKFGDALYEIETNLNLIDETNTLENVNIKIKNVIDKPEPKRIVGMAPLKTKNNQKDEKFKVNHEIDLYEFEKKQRDDNSTIRVNNLPPDIEYRTLYYYFDQYGYIEDRGIKIKSYSDNTMAFIRYSNHREAECAIENLNKKAIDYYIIDVEFAKPI